MLILVKYEKYVFLSNEIYTFIKAGVLLTYFTTIAYVISCVILLRTSLKLNIFETNNFIIIVCENI